MFRHSFGSRRPVARPHLVRPPRRQRVLAHRSLVCSFLLTLLLLLSQVLGNWGFLVKPAEAASAATPRSTPPSFTFQQYLKQGQQPTARKSGPPSPYPQPPKSSSAKAVTPKPSAEPPTMQPITQPLTSAFLAGSTGASPLDLKGSDGRMEVQLQPGSLDLSHASIASGNAPVGTFTLQITQVHGHFIGMLNLLGYYQAQIVDSQGQVVQGIVLHTPVTILYHYQPSELLSLNLDPTHILLSWPTLIAAAQQAKQPATNLVIAMRDDPTTHTLTAQSSVLGPGPYSLGGDAQNQMAPIPHLAEVQGNNGQLSYSYPLQVVPGSGGFTPQLMLGYSSVGPNDRHNNTSPADDLGDGWSLSLGSITADTYPSGTTWYFLNGIDNVGDRLIQYDTTNKLYYTEHLSYLRIQQVTGADGQPCFDVWDKAGTFYEVGCTTDALEYTMSGTTRDNYQWNVDRIIAPNEGAKGTTSKAWRIILISYLQDCGSASTTQPCPSGNTIRDSVIKQINYGYNNTGNNALTTLDATAGTIDFLYRAPFGYSSGGVTWATAYGNNYNCSSGPPTTTTLRCDDPIQKSGGFTAPDAMGTFSLLTMTSYLNTDSSANAAYGYAFSYTDNPFRSCTDPISGTSGYCAGEHLLTQLTPSVYQSGAAKTLRATTFSYSPAYGQTGALIDTYYDSLHNGQGSQPFTNSTSWQYLTSYHDLDTSIGETITYASAHNNTDGTPTLKDGSGNVTDDRYDALYCTNHSSDCSSGSYSGHYAHPDDHAWSVQVVTTITSSGEDSSALSAATTTFNYYRLANTGTYSGSGAWCYPDQYSQENACVGDNWLPNGDTDWQDYYHTEFRGFAQAWQLSPANDLTVGYYLSTEGWNKPATDPADYLAGQMYQQEVYQGSSYDATKLLSRTINTYPGPYPANTTTNPTACYTPSGSSPYAACDIVLLNSNTTEYDETNSSNAPWTEHDYSYDDYDTTNGLKSGFHNLTQEVIKGSNLPGSVYPLTEKWSYATNTSTPSGWTYYTVDTANHSEVDDNSGHSWQCQYTKYDEGNTNPTPSAGWPTTVNTYSSANCANQTSPTLTTTYAAYDQYGHAVATVDGVGAATPSLYNSTGCTVTSGTIEIANSAWTKGRYTTCASFDSGHYQALPVSTTNAFSQATSFTYDATQGNMLTQSQDPNSQITKDAYSYDGSGNRTVQVTLPPDSAHYTTQTNSYSTCTGSSTLPCFEVDKLSYLYNTVLASTFYDSRGRAVETSTPGPAPANPSPNTNYYTIVFTYYNDAQHSTYQSEPFVVAVPNTQHGSGYIDPNGAKDYLGNTVGGTATYDDALGHVLAVRDPLFGSSGEPGIACSSILSGNYTACTNYTVGQVSGDSNYYISVTSIDPNKHVDVSFLDALGRTVYMQQDSGTYGGTLTVNQQTTTAYNALDKPTSVTVTDKAPQSGQTITSVSTTAQYDDLGRLTQLADPDRGTHTYSYDADGKIISDVSGARTIGSVYDLLERLGCVQDTAPAYSPTGACSGGNPYIVNTYDSNKLTISGTTDYPVGQLTQSVSTTYFSGSAASVTELYEHDARGRGIGEQLQFSLPSSWNVTTALPTSQAQESYNDADQLTTTTTSSINPSGQGFTTTQVYDSTTGVKTGLSNNGTATANLATLSYTSSAQLNSLNFLSSSGGALSTDAYGYDGNLRLSGLTATWQGGSGNSGTYFSQTLNYDPASNLTSLATTQAAVTGNSNTGGSETQVFCYDEQNRLLWAGNTGTPTCTGNGTPSVSGHIAGYNNSYAYTHLGQLWQGPLAGGSTQYQYLYCSSSQPHELTGLYGTSATCSNKTGQGYASSYDGFGNVTSRTFSGTTGTLTYDILDHLTQWYAGSTNQEQYLYDASGQRMLRRFTNSNGTTILTYPFGIEEHQYSGAGSNQWNVYYYFLAGRLLGSLDGNGTQFYLVDALGSLVSDFNNAAGGAALKGNQLFGPYGVNRYFAGNINTAKGFIGQYNDGTGLDYLNARYYDPVVGVFLSADTVQGNPQGLNPYAYVNGNPETHSDPSGRMFIIAGGGGGGGPAVSPPSSPPPPSSCSGFWCWAQAAWHGAQQLASTAVHVVAKVADFATGFSSMVSDVRTVFSSRASFWDKVGAVGDFALNAGMDVAMLTGIGEAARGVDLLVKGGVDLGEHLVEGEGADTLEHVAADLGCGPLSFAPATLVATAKGEQAIGTLRVGEKVWAYNPKTHKMEQEPILHVWINHDNDLVDLTLTTTTPAGHGKAAAKTSETIHTNKKHPFLTKEKGFLTVGQITLGMHVLRADGTYGVVTGWKVVPGAEVMYNLEVAQDHTFTVGDGQWVVHNCGPEAMEGTTTQDLYRQGGINAGPKLGYAREGIEASGGIVSPDKGTSLWASMFKGEKPQGWWKLPVGSSIPEGYRFVSTGIINNIEHWEFRPIQEVTLQAFEEAANSITEWSWMGKF